jgi:hypothetical protein
MPARDFRVVVKLVGQIPAEHDVAEAQPALGRREELVDGDVFAAPNTVDVDSAHFDFLDALLLEPSFEGFHACGFPQDVLATFARTSPLRQ